MMDQAINLMSSMPQEQLDAIAAASGAPAGIKITPELARMAAEQMKAMPQDDLHRMARQAGPVAQAAEAAAASHGFGSPDAGASVLAAQAMSNAVDR